MSEEQNDTNPNCLEFVKHPGVRGIVVPVDLLEHISIDNGKLVVQLKSEEDYSATQRNTTTSAMSVHRIKRKVADWFARRNDRRKKRSDGVSGNL